MRVALIGLGRIGWQLHIKEIDKHDGLSLCAVVDTNAERIREAEEQYGAVGYQDYRDMLQKEKPDMVVIASPTIFHEEQAVASLEAGADVFLDKPMTIGMESARRIAAAVERTGKKLVVFQPHRAAQMAVAAKQIIERGVLGKIFEIRRVDNNYVRRNDWQAFKEFGGGMLNNYGAHYIDQLLYLSGEKTKQIYCSMKKIASLGDAEDVVRILLTTESGMTLNVEINQASAMYKNDMMICGEYGTAWVGKDEEGRSAFRIKYYDPAEVEPAEADRKLEAKGRSYGTGALPWKSEWLPLAEVKPVDFYSACRDYFLGKGPSPVPVEDTLEVMRIIEECEKYR